MGDYGFDGAGEFGGQDTNFNCLPDGWRKEEENIHFRLNLFDLVDCPFREYLHNDLLNGDNAGSYKCKSPTGESEPGEYGGPGDFSDCKCCTSYSLCKFFPRSIYSGVGGRRK